MADESLNRKWWDEVTPHHLKSRSYDVDGFLAGKNTLLPLELVALGDVKGRRLLHLQCHIGLDTISWARLGARATGVDFSGAAVKAATDLAARAGMAGQADFIEADVLEWHKVARAEFDMVVSTYGVLCWLGDLEAWAKGVAASLKPGGIFFLADGHPLAETIFWETGLGEQEPVDYFGRCEGYGVGSPAPDYASAHVVKEGNQQWIWPLSKVVQGLVDAGLRLEHIEEHPYSFYEHVKGLLQRSDGYWYLPPGAKQIPLTFSLKMRS